MSTSNLTIPQQAPQLIEVRTHTGGDLARHLPRLEAYVATGGQVPLSRHPAWLPILADALRHTPYCLEAVEDGKTRGILALAYVHSLLFGRFLVSLPYLNYGGPVADDDQAARLLIDRAVQLADQLNVRHLELRNEWAVEHPALGGRSCTKVNMRMPLPKTTEQLWKQLDAKVRNQVRKGQKSQLATTWGGEELLPEFYAVFSQNMRDLGTPVYSKALFRSILRQFAGRAELCVLRADELPVAGALLLHGWEITEVPSASSLRSHNASCANMLMYHQLLERAVQRGQTVFDFGRSSEDASTFRFKKQWGAQPSPAEWQRYQRRGEAADLRPDSPKYQKLVRIWQRLPVALTRLIGPPIVRGIP